MEIVKTRNVFALFLLLSSWARNGSLQRAGAPGIGPSRGLLDKQIKMPTLSKMNYSSVSETQK